MKNIEKQVEFYNEYWSNRQFLNSLKLRRSVKILEYFTKVKREIKEPRIIELGCGDGRFTSFIGEFGKTDAIELSELAVKNAKIKYPHINFFYGNALTYPLEDSKYDVVISQEVVEHIEDQARYIDVCSSILKDGGYLIMTTPNKRVFDHYSGGNWSNQPIEKILTPKEFKKIVSAKFDIIDYTSIILNFGTIGYFKILNYKYIIGAFNKLRLRKFREYILGKLGFGLHQCLIAVKKTNN